MTGAPSKARSTTEQQWAALLLGSGSGDNGRSMTLLDDWMPAFDVSARHALDVRASAARTYEAARTMDLGAPPLVRALMGLRAIPALASRALGQRAQVASLGKERGPSGLPFTLLADTPGSEFVMGLAGRFWTPSGGIVHSDAAAFRSPPPSGLAHAAWNFRVEPRAGGCTVTTETRVLCADEATRAQFLRYWRVVRFGSGMIRRSMLREIRRRAERR
jgi:hypothetical protein